MRSAHLRAIALLSFGSLFACGGSSPPPPAPVTAKPASSTATPATTCTGDAIDPSALFTAHASAFGTAADAAAAFPLTFSGDVTINGKKGKFTRSIDKTRSKSTTDLPGLARADGVDAEGPWQIGGSGALLRLRPDEARSFDEWVLRREYIGAFKTGRDHARCEPSREGDRVVVTEEIPELGKPVLVFDRKTSALLATEHETVVGTRATTKYVWNDPTGHGVVWPAQTTDYGGGPIVRVDLAKPSPAAADAFAVPGSRFTFTFPKSGAVTVPMKFYGSELLLKIKVGGKDATALLDSGAGISLAESGGKVAASFTPLLDFEGQSATQKLTFGLGEIPNVT
ncbi:MAG TPA: hypothetical protein VF407_12755, partial [Polyangiaceae bacterium]